MAELKNPYVGPRTFSEAEAHLFFGREREARDLLALVLSKRLVLFYAQSGAGKSSLLNTRLIPGLRAEGFEGLPVGRVSGDPPPNIDPASIANIFVFNLLLSLDPNQAPARLTQTPLADFLAGGEGPPPAQVSEEYELVPHILVIDQFEEILTAHLERWQERQGFFEQLAGALDQHPNLWVVLTMREDYVTGLDPYAQLLPNRLRDRFYMQRMDFDTALKAVTRPAAQYERPYAGGVAEMLVNNLRQIRLPGQDKPQAGQYVEPVQLQVVCYQLWENTQGQTEITRRDLPLDHIDKALIEFYENTLHSVCKQTGLKEGAVRQWFGQQLITEAGTRGTIYRGESQTAGLPNEAVDTFVNRFLLRPEIRAGGTWYELTHDRFIGPIQQSNEQWRTERWQRLWGTVLAATVTVLLIAMGWLYLWQNNQVSALQRSLFNTEMQAQVVEATSTAIAKFGRVRLVNAVPDAPPLSLYIDGNLLFSDTEYGTIPDYYVRLAPGERDVSALNANLKDETDRLVQANLDFIGEGDYTVVVAGSVGRAELWQVKDDNSPPPAGQARIRAIHAAPNAPPLDVCFAGSAPCLTENLAYANSSAYLELAAGDYDLEVSRATSDIIYDAPRRFELLDGGVYTLFVFNRVANGRETDVLQVVESLDSRILNE